MNKTLKVGGIYNIKRAIEDDYSEYLIVMFNFDGNILVHRPSVYMDITPVNNRYDLQELVLIGIQMNMVGDDSFRVLKDMDKNMIDGYMGQVNDNCLFQLQSLAKLKYQDF